MSKIRIGIYKDTLANRRGADVAVLNLADGLGERGHVAEVFEKGALAEKVREPWDVVIATGTNELLDLAAIFPKKFPWPVVMQFHTTPKSQFKWKRFVRNWRIRRALKRTSVIQVLREEFVPQVAKYGAQVAVIGNWSKYENEPPPPAQEKTIIYPAAWNKDKNQQLLVKAFELARKNFPDWTLELYGNGKIPEKLPDGVKAMGYCDLREAFRRCAFLAFPSLDEGFPLTVTDAAVFGKPAVLVKDWIGTCANGGGLVEPNDPKEFAMGLKLLMGNAALVATMGAEARKFCLAKYSRTEILTRWEELLKEIGR